MSAPPDTAPRLVVGPSWVGDMMMAQAMLVRLRERVPGAAIDVLAPGWSAGLLSRMPEVRRCIEVPFGHGDLHWRARRALARRLRGEGYAQAIVLPGSWKSALVPYFARIPLRTGYVRELRYGLLNDARRLDRERLATTALQYVALAQAPDEPVGEVPQPRLRTDPARAAQLCAQFCLDAGARVVALVPGAEYGPAKRWPAASFAELARTLAARDVQCWVFGSDKERALGAEIAGLAGAGVTSLCGRTRLEDVMDLMSLCRAAVTNDSGLMHVAAGVGIPVIALYGSSTPYHTPPLTTEKVVHYLHLGCSPCFKRRCPLGHLHCLNWIQPADVAASTMRAGTL